MPHIFVPQVDSLDAVPAPFHGLYAKNDSGKFVMDPETFKHVDPAGYQSALDKERKVAKEALKALEPWKALGDDPTKISEELTALKEQIAKGDKSAAGQFDKYKQEVTALHAQEIAKRDEANANMQRTLESYLVESEASRILAEAKGSPALLMPHIKGSVKVLSENGKYVVRVVDAEGDPRISAQTGNPLTLSELVNELKSHAEFGKAFEPSGTTGSGTRPGMAGTARNPGDASKLSATEKIARGLNQSGVR